MQWISCGTATVRASGGLRTQEEMAREPALLQAYPDIYQSAAEAQAHGATLRGALFRPDERPGLGRRNLHNHSQPHQFRHPSAQGPKSDRHRQWRPVGQRGSANPVRVRPRDRTGGRHRSFARRDGQELAEQTAALVGQKNVLWHQAVLLLRTGVPHVTEIVGASGSQGGRSLEPRWGSLPWALRKEMSERGQRGGKRGPLESYYATNILFSLLRMAGADIVPPAPLPNVPMPKDHLHVRISAGGTWAAVTQRHLAVVNRGDFWHWTVYNDRAIGETPEFTRTVIEHELEHAADYERDLRDFEKLEIPGRPARFRIATSSTRRWRPSAAGTTTGESTSMRSSLSRRNGLSLSGISRSSLASEAGPPRPAAPRRLTAGARASASTGSIWPSITSLPMSRAAPRSPARTRCSMHSRPRTPPCSVPWCCVPSR